MFKFLFRELKVNKKELIKIFIMLLSIMCFIIIMFLFFYNIMGIIIHSKKEVIVPNIENKSVIEALEIVSKVGLGLKKIGESYNPNYPEGTIITQRPPAGMTVREGRFIGVILSLGGEKVFVPNLVGEERRKAEILLRQYSLFVGTVTKRYSLKYDIDKVISQSPTAGEIVEKNSYVNIDISLGHPPKDVLLMPDFINKNIEEVYIWSARNNIEVKVNEKNFPDLNNGTVIEQYPQPDTVIDSGTKVEITVVKNNRVSSEIQSVNYNFEYELPFISNVEKNVKVVQISSEGEYVLYDKPTLPRQKIKLYVPRRKDSKIRIFVDNILIDEINR